MTDLKFVSDDTFRKRLLYFKVIYFVGLIVFTLYILKFNLEYRVTTFNPVLFPVWAIFILIPPLIFRFTKNYLYSALVLGSAGSFLLIYMLYISGGANAPGVFWLAAVPLSLGVLLGLPGTYAGYTAITIAFIYFLYIKAHHLTPNIVEGHADYSFEKLFNLIIFLLFSSFTTHQYIRGEQRWMQRLVEKNIDIDNLLRVLLHDIANSLSSMTYNLLRARKIEPNSLISSELERMEKSINDINNLLTQVRHLKSVKDGKISLPLKPISLTVLLNEVYETSFLSAQQKNIDLQLEISCKSMLISGEKTILSNVILMNLLSNAIKFSEPGGYIILRAYCASSEVVIEIQDNGIGIPEAILKQIFDIHVQTSRSGTLGEKGTGYGLPLVKQYLEMMNGNIDIFSQEKATPDHPRGTRVTLKFPQTKKLCGTCEKTKPLN